MAGRALRASPSRIYLDTCANIPITGDLSLFTGPLHETKPRSGAVVLTQAGPALGLDMTLLPYGQLLDILGGDDLVTEGGRLFAWTGSQWRFELNADGLLELLTSNS